MALLLFAGVASAQLATDTGTGATTAGPVGEVQADLLYGRDRNGLGTPAANVLKLRENHVDLVTNPSCASECKGADTEIRMCLIDANEADGTRDWRLCENEADYARLVNTGSDQIADTQILVGSGAGVGAYVTVSGDATLSDAGALAVVDDSHSHTGSTISGLDISDDTNLAVSAPIVLTGDTLSFSSLQSLAQHGDLCAADQSVARNGADSANVCITPLTAEVDGSTTNEIEVVDEAYSAANFNGGTSTAVSQDDLYDLIHAGDADDDGKPDILDTTTNGFVKTTGGTGAISIDTSTYLTAEVDGSTTNEIQNLFETFDASSGTDPVADSPTDTLAITGTAPIVVTGNSTTDTLTLTCIAASGSVDGCLSSTDWTTFNNKQAGPLSGDVVTSGAVATIQANSVALATDTTGSYVADITGGAGLAASGGGSENATVTLATASTEAGFLTDGATTDLTCSTSNQGKMQTLDDGQLQWCDGATTSVLRRAAFGNSSGEGTAAANDSVALTTDTTGNYVTSVATTSPLTGGASASEGATLTLSLSQNAGTDVTADLEEETHASEHSVGGGDTITVTNLASACTDAQVLGGNSGATGVECQTDDDVPEAADYSNLTAGTGITNSPTGTINSTLGTAVDTSEITDATIAQVDIDDTATLAGDPANGASSVWFATTGLIWEGTSSDTNEGLLIWPTIGGDRTITLPDETGTACTTGSVCTGYQAGPLSGDVVTSGAASTIQANSVALTTDTTGNYVTSLSVSSPIACTGCTAAEGGTPALSITADSVGPTQIDETAAYAFSGQVDFSGQLEAPNSTATISGECDAAGEAGRLYVDSDASTGDKLKVCTGAGGWENADSGTASSMAFSAITGATNTTAAMLVGTGGSLGVSGSGTISATDLTCTTCVATTEVATGVTLDTEWDTAAEINTATSDDDFVTLTGTQTISGAKTYSGTNNFTSGTLRLPNSTTAMTTCSTGDLKQDSDAAAGSRLLLCVATDTPVGIDSALGSEVDTSELANTLTFTSSHILDLATNDAALRIAKTTSDPASEGGIVIDNATDELEWYGSSLHGGYDYVRLAGRTGGQTIYGAPSSSAANLTLLGGATSDGSDDRVASMGGGGAAAESRGGSILTYGNEPAGGVVDGMVAIVPGDDSANGSFGVYTNAGGLSFLAGADFAVEYDGNVCIQSPSANYNACSRTLGIGGTAARNIGMERHTTANTAGNALTVNAGGATSAATDKAGGDLILAPGESTGTGRTNVKVQGYTTASSTGTSTNTAVEVAVFNGFKALTDNSAIGIVNATLASNTVAGGRIDYTIEVFNGTDLQVESGSVVYSITNKGGVFANNTATEASQQAATSGTLTTDWAISAANPAVISVNANTSLTPSTGYPRIRYVLHSNSGQAVAIQ